MKPEQALILNKEWIEEKLEDMDYNLAMSVNDKQREAYKGQIHLLKQILNEQSKPLLPILEETFKAGNRDGREGALFDMGHICRIECTSLDEEEYLNNLDI